MKRLIIFVQAILMLTTFVSCEKEPYEAANLTYEPVLRIFNRDYADADGLHVQTSSQEAILNLDPLYQLYYFLERPRVTCYTGVNYSGCSVETLYNYINDSVDGEYYSIIFDRNLVINDEDRVLTYTIFYYLDRSVQSTLVYDDEGYLMTNSDGTPATEDGYLEGSLTVTDESGNVLVSHDNIQILVEDRAV